jgi:hypothetical protein
VPRALMRVAFKLSGTGNSAGAACVSESDVTLGRGQRPLANARGSVRKGEHIDGKETRRGLRNLDAIECPQIVKLH